MATAGPVKPLPHPQKHKRPPPPFVQTSANGTKPSNPSASPSSSSKRPPGQKLPPSASSANGATTNGANVRSANRQRKEPQRPGDAYDAKRQRLTTRSGALDVSGVDRRTAKKVPEPYGKSNQLRLLRSVRCLTDANIRNSCFRRTHSEEVCWKAAITDNTPSSDTLPIRPARWQFPLQL